MNRVRKPKVMIIRVLNAIWLLTAFLFLAPGEGDAGIVEGQFVVVTGHVVNPDGEPLPGMLVSIATTSYRRSSYTNRDGSFEIGIIASYQDTDQDLFLEIYWSEELMFRQPLIDLHINRATYRGYYGTVQFPDWDPAFANGR
jgi:hypothetical protein